MDVNLLDPRAMPVDEYLAETIAVLGTDAPKAYVERTCSRRNAMRPEEIEATRRFNDMMAH